MTTSVITDGHHLAADWISCDEHNLLVAAEERIWQSFDGGDTWHTLPNIREGVSNVHKTSTGDIYIIADKYLYKLVNNKWEPIEGGYDYSTGHCLASIGSTLYWLNSQQGRLLKLPANGEWTVLVNNRSETHHAKYIITVGNSLVLGGLNWLGVIEHDGGELTWYETDLDSGAQYMGDRLVCDGNNIIVRQSEQTRNARPIAIIWPVAITKGAMFDVSIKWLAENN